MFYLDFFTLMYRAEVRRNLLTVVVPSNTEEICCLNTRNGETVSLIFMFTVI